MHKIAVWNTAFLGDAVLTLPLIQTLRRAYPEAEIDYYVRKGIGDIFCSHPDLSAVYEYDKNGQERSLKKTRQFIARIREREYSLWVSAHRSLRSAYIAAKSGAPVRIGYNRPLLSRFFYTSTVSRHFAKLDEIERLLELAKPLKITDFSTWPEVVLPAQSALKAEEFFKGLNGAPVLGMHPGSVWPTKRWPLEYFAQIGLMALETGAQVILFSGPGEESMASEVYHRIKKGIAPEQLNFLTDRLIDLSGVLSLPDLSAFIGRLDCYLTNDSGPMHLAWAQHAPVVALFGPTVRQLGFAPRGEHACLLEIEGLPCRPCGLHGPKTCPEQHHHCMRFLRPELVWPAVESRIFRKK